MSNKRRFKGWWVICLMAGLGAQPLQAAEPGAISRAVEVPPPKGWTPDTPLFHDEGGAPADGDGRPAQRLAAATSTANPSANQAPPARRTTREPRPAERLVATKREPVARAKTSSEASLKEAKLAKAKAPKTRASAAVSARSGERPAVRAQRGDRGAARTAATKRNPARGEVVAASPQRRASTRVAGRNPAAAGARSTQTRRAVASLPRAQVDRRKPATRVGGGRASTATLSRARQGMANDPGRSAKARQKTVASAGKVARERTLAQRSARRAQPGAPTGARARSPGVKKG
ncbi:MAG: hypothetical protein A2711_10700 [Burkholderiales bacterium RIFCSPHIGHO2_01_FULL_63_240]|jgi:hypothetical protein|nr:MAG: hypothetical protein A2711_10700 [Burkholderiales bacterium RIFCSPHIGHO2_01_FULL_63_240]